MSIKKMKIDGYRIRIVYKDLGQEKYLKKVEKSKKCKEESKTES